MKQKKRTVIQVNISQDQRHFTPLLHLYKKLGQAPAVQGTESKGRVSGTNRSGLWCLLKRTLPEANGNTGRLCFSFFLPPSLASCSMAKQPTSFVPVALRVNHSAFDHFELPGWGVSPEPPQINNPQPHLIIRRDVTPSRNSITAFFFCLAAHLTRIHRIIFPANGLVSISPLTS